MGVEQAVVSLAEFLGVHQRTCWKWISRGLEPQDPEAVIQFLRGLKRPPATVAARLAEPNLEQRLSALLCPLGDEPFARRVLRKVRDGLLGVVVSTQLFSGDAELVGHFGGDLVRARRQLGVTGERELATLLFAVRSILETEVEAIDDAFAAAMGEGESEV